MPRKMRVFIPGGFYHVYCRVARGEFVFDEPSEVERWIDVVAFVSRLHDLRCLAWALMSNHYHLLLQTGSMPLWKAMARIQVRFSKGFNRQRRLRGRVWQSRYKARLILDNEQLQHVIAYIHLNPVAAGIVDDPLDYPSSGHREIVGARAVCLCDVNACLQSFDEDRSTARSSYLDRLRTVSEARWLRADVRELPWWKSLGDNEQTLAVENAPADATDFTGQALAPEEQCRPPLVAVLDAFENELGIARSGLSGHGRTSLMSWHRCLFATFSVSWLGHPAKAVAQVLDKGPGSVSRWVAEGLELQLSDASFRSQLEQLARAFGLETSNGAVRPSSHDPETTS